MRVDLAARTESAHPHTPIKHASLSAPGIEPDEGVVSGERCQRPRLLGRESIVVLRRFASAVAVGLTLVTTAACGGAAKPTASGVHSTATSSPSTTSASTSVATSATEPVSALQTHNPTVVVSPGTGLFDDQEVLVTVTGFGIGGKVWLSQCAVGSNANGEGCGQGLPEQTLLVTDDNGGGSVAFQVQSSAAAQPNNLTTLDACVNNCVLVATVGSGYGFADASLRFVSSPPPTCMTPQLHVSAGKAGVATGHSGFPCSSTTRVHRSAGSRAIQAWLF
jgi:hypothetical protein